MNMNLPKSMSALLVSLLVSACHQSSTPAPTVSAGSVEPISVEVANPTPVPNTETIRSMGRLETSEEATLSFKSAGVIADITVDIGDRVEQGQLLAKLESTELAAARSRAREALAKTNRDLKRSEELFERGVIPLQTVDDAHTAREIAAADLATAEFNLSLAEIRAPASGRILQRLAEPREIIAPGTPILKVSGDTRDWVLRIDVSDRHVVRIDPQVRAWIRFDALPDQEFGATVSRVSAEANPATAMFRVEFVLTDSDSRLRSGMLGTAFIELESDQPGLLVPVDSLVDAGPGRARLFVANSDGKASLKEVSTGKLRENGIVVTRGLSAADNVIVRGASFVDDGSPITINQG